MFEKLYQEGCLEQAALVKVDKNLGGHEIISFHTILK